MSLSQPPTIVFAGSFLDYSAIILKKLLDSPIIKTIGVLTTPPSPDARSKALTPNPVHQLATQHQIPVLTPAILNDDSLQTLTQTVGQPDILLTAGYGKLLPTSWLTYPTLAALNLHFSLLPAYRGANPAEYALLRGEIETGVTLIEMSPTFDTGKLVAQAKIDITTTETRESLYQKLYTLGGDTLPKMIEEYVQFSYEKENNLKSSVPGITFFLPPIDQAASPTPYAQRLNREAGYVAWSALAAVMAGEMTEPTLLSPQLATIWKTTKSDLNAIFIERAVRALSGFPGVWTKVETTKGLRRLKILSSHLENNRLVLDDVQLEGQAPSAWRQIQTALKSE